MNKHKVVIVGGGFGGIKAALELCGDRRFDITLVSDNSEFEFHPTLYRTATGGKKMISSIPLKEIFHDKRLDILKDKAVGVDRQNHHLLTAGGQKLPYDALIIAIGGITNYFGIKGLEEYSYGIKSLKDAMELKCRLHQQLIDENQPALNYVVVGGGPTGVELAGALPAYIKQLRKHHNLKPQKIHIDLIEAAPRLLPRMPKDLSRKVARRLRRLGVKIYLKTPVEAQTVDALMAGGRPIRSHTVIWTAGVANHPFFTDNNFQIAKNGKIRIDQFLQAEPGIYVIGDNADTPYTGMAQTALYDAIYVAKNLIRLANNKTPRPYKAKLPVYVTPAGPHWAAVLWGPVRIYGRLGWVLRRLADLVAYHDFQPWKIATKRWMAEDDQEETCPQCADDLAESVFLQTR